MGEQQVAALLQRKGFTLLESNYRTRQGEVDLILCKADLYSFVEIKTRTKHFPEYSRVITLNKQRRIALAARHYLISKNISSNTYVIRFDVAFVINGVIEYIENAFCPS